MGVCNCSMFCCTLLYVNSSIAIILMGKRELVGLLNLSTWCLVMVEWFFLAVPWGCLRFVIVVFPDHNHSLFLMYYIVCHRNPNCHIAMSINAKKGPGLTYILLGSACAKQCTTIADISHYRFCGFYRCVTYKVKYL